MLELLERASASPKRPRSKAATPIMVSKALGLPRQWFIAFRDDLAVAVLVERGRSGGSVAAPLAARFFTALDSDR